MGSLSLLQGIFPTQGSNSGLPHSREILYQLSHRGSPNILEWVSPVLSPWDLPDPGIEPESPALQADSLPTELSGKPPQIKMSGDQACSDPADLTGKSHPMDDTVHDILQARILEWVAIPFPRVSSQPRD